MNQRDNESDSTTKVSEPPSPRYIAKPTDSWLEAVGVLKESELSEEAFRLGAEWRERMNRDEN